MAIIEQIYHMIPEIYFRGVKNEGRRPKRGQNLLGAMEHGYLL